MFNYAYWSNEVQIFRGVITNRGLADQVHAAALNGLTVIAMNTVEADPAHKDQIATEYGTLLDLAEQVKGSTWMGQRKIALATHGRNSVLKTTPT